MTVATPLKARAVAMAYELHRLLGEICDLPGMAWARVLSRRGISWTT
jgi:hypothetical protein